jgi:HEAT repeat protein
MIGDSDDRVRLEVATAVQKFNDREALEAMLTQLSRERNPQVRAAFAKALGPIGDVRAAPVLISLLDDPATVVDAAAADAIRQLSEKLSPEQRREAASKLRGLLDRASGPGSQSLRESVVDAMVPLRQHELLGLFQQLLGRSESRRIRHSAAKGIAEAGDRNYADLMATFLDDRDTAVQQEAIRAVRNFGAVEHLQKVVRLMDPANSPDESIQREAWDAVASLIADMPAAMLSSLASQVPFSGDPAKRLLVLQALAARLEQDRDVEQLATTVQNIGTTQSELGQFEASAASFKRALELLAQQPGANEVVKQRLIEARLTALLRSGKYEDAIAYGGQVIASDRRQQQTVGPGVKLEAERLLDEAHRQHTSAPLEGALRLINQARQMNPPLAQQYQDQLTLLEKQVRSEIAGNNRGSILPERYMPLTTVTP